MTEIYTRINRQLSHWISCANSNRDFALNHNIDEKTVRRILEGQYRISIGTLQKICDGQGISLQTFFEKIDR